VDQDDTHPLMKDNKARLILTVAPSLPYFMIARVA
jgi:hypothetical protein